MNQLIVEDRCDRLAQPIQQFHLNVVPVGAIRSFEPQGFLVIDQKAVSINADAESPASISLPQVLERSVPNQPIHQKGLQALFSGW